MEKLLKILVYSVFIIFSYFIPVQSIAQDLSKNLNGQYTMTTEGTVLTLIVKQDQNQKITGSLSSTTGIRYNLDGDITEGVAVGICSNKEGSVYFEMYKVDNELYVSLIEADASNMPDYNTAKYLSFTEKSTSVHEITSEKPSNTSNNQAMSENAIGDPSWGFKLIPPAGWTHQQTSEGIILGHNTIAGMILVFPHMLQNMQEVQQEMYNGIQEEGSYLSINGTPTTVMDNILSGNYTGIMDGQQVKARGFGTLSPYGGGAFVIAVSTPEKLGAEIIQDANTIASTLVYSKIDASDLMRHFAGKWTNFTTNTSTWIQLYPNGTYDKQYESSYSGELNGGGNWGTAGSDSAKGRWTARGNKDSGSIIVKLSNGNEIIYEYRVHEERGQKYYGEYWFNGKLYSKS